MVISNTIVLIILTVILSLLSFPNQGNSSFLNRSSNGGLFNKLKFNAYMVYHRKEWWRMISHGFLHADWIHLLMNMYVLYYFGTAAEEYFVAYFGLKGRFMYLLLYLLSIPLASLSDLYKHKNNHYYNAVGASGAVAAAIFACILFDPLIGISMFFLPVRIPGFIFAILYLAYSQYMIKKSSDNIGHSAHFWGSCVGFVIPILFKPILIYYFIKQILGIF